MIFESAYRRRAIEILQENREEARQELLDDLKVYRSACGKLRAALRVLWQELAHRRSAH